MTWSWGDMVMDRKGLRKVITCKLHNEPDPGCPQECIGGCEKSGKINGAMESPDIVTPNSMYNAVIFEKGERSRAVRSYSDVTREDVKTPLGKNRFIIF